MSSLENAVGKQLIKIINISIVQHLESAIA
jgi:hypothetical protein